MPDESSPLPAYLVIEQEGRWSDVFNLNRECPAILGRSSQSDIVVRVEGVSRQHTEVFFDSTSRRWMVRDLNSRNGTFVDGKRIEDAVALLPNQTITLVEFSLRFTDDLSPPHHESSVVGGDTQATITVDPAWIQTRMDRSGWLTDDDDRVVLADKVRTPDASENFDDDQSMVPTHAETRAALLRLSFQMARMTDVDDMLNAGAMCLQNAIGGAAVSFVQTQTSAGKRTSRDIHDDAKQLALAHPQSRQATLMRNLSAGDGDTLGALQATAAIVAPVHVGDDESAKRWGHIVVTTTAMDRALQTHHLRATVAVAEMLSLRLADLTTTHRLVRTLERSRQQVRWLQQTIGDRMQIIGRSDAMAKIIDQIRKVAPTPSTVLIRGESGVGKELVAAAIHHASDRRDGPLVCLNCAAISPSLLESELFGHERGAFTGADTRRRGKFESAHRGTILLDEIGEMSAETQTKFLRVLETRSFQRVGGETAIEVDVRVIAATHRDLRQMVDDGGFRQDLYYRLHVVELNVPPLRDRGDDILRLVNHFIQHFAREIGRPTAGVDDEAALKLRNYHWPGNIRELRNVIERAVVLTDRPILGVSDLLMSPAGTHPETSTAEAPVEITLAELQRRHIDRVLAYTENNKTRAAAILGIERSTLDRKLKRRQN